MATNANSIMNDGLDIRAAAESLIRYEAHMRETESAFWGPAEQARAAEQRLTLKGRAAQFASDLLFGI